MYGTESLKKKLMGPLCGGSSKRKDVASQRAVIDSGADLNIWNLKDAMNVLSDLQISKLDVIGVNGKTIRADRQGSLVVLLKGPKGTECNLDLGTAHALKSCPVNLLSLSRLVGVGAILHFEKNERWIQPPARFQSHGGGAWAYTSESNRWFVCMERIYIKWLWMLKTSINCHLK